MVWLGGQYIKEMVTYAIFKKLIKLIYSYYGTVPLDNLKFIIVIRDAGLIYKFFIL